MRPARTAGSEQFGAEAFARELERSRRYGREFCLVKIERARDQAGPGAGGWVGSIVRRVDVVWTEGRTSLVLLPESGRSAGLRLVERLAGCSREPTAGSAGAASYSVVAFPADGFTSETLVAALASPENRIDFAGRPVGDKAGHEIRRTGRARRWAAGRARSAVPRDQQLSIPLADRPAAHAR